MDSHVCRCSAVSDSQLISMLVKTTTDVKSVTDDVYVLRGFDPASIKTKHWDTPPADLAVKLQITTGVVQV